MYSTFGSSRLPVICDDSRSRRSFALPFLVGSAAPGLLAAVVAPTAGVAGLTPAATGLLGAGLAAGAAGTGCGAAEGAEVLTPGSMSAAPAFEAALGGGVWATAAAANN